MDLSAKLEKRIPHPCSDRPFVCDGFPDSCDVIVIGENPAMKMNTDWWSFWDNESGFNLGKFEQTYAKARQDAGKSAASNTRLRLKRCTPADCRV